MTDKENQLKEQDYQTLNQLCGHFANLYENEDDFKPDPYFGIAAFPIGPETWIATNDLEVLTQYLSTKKE